MKIKMHKHSMTRLCSESEVELLKSAGWTQSAPQELAGEVIRLKPAVKPKATVRVLDEATITKGDE
jgi:hypothetical protein